MGPPDYDDDDDANSMVGFLGWFYHLDEGHAAGYLQWRFTLFLAFGLVVWGFFLYKVIISSFQYTACHFPEKYSLPLQRN